MKRTLLLPCCILLTLAANAQVFDYVKPVGATNPDWASAITSASSEHAYTTGNFTGTVDFDPGPGVYNLTSSSYEIFISDYDSLGNLIWAGSIGGPANDQSYAMCADISEDLILTGYFQNTADFDPGAGTFNMTAQSSDIFICKLNNNGTFVWAKQIGGTLNDEGHGVTTDAAGNIYVTGYFRSTADFDPGPGVYNLTATGTSTPFVVKLTSAGNFVWAAAFDGGYGQGNGVAVDQNGNIYCAGYFGNTADFDPGAPVFNMISGGLSDAYLVKLNNDGSFDWAKQINGTDMSQMNSVVVNDDGYIYVTGDFMMTNDFDPGAGINNISSVGLYDAFLQKYDNSGIPVWTKTWGSGGSDYSVCVIRDVNNNLFMTGSFAGTCDFDPGAGTTNLTTFGQNDSYILLLDSLGNFEWVKQMGGTGTDYSVGLALRFGSLFSAGAFSGTCDFDPDAPVFNVTSNGGTDAYTHRMIGITTGISNIEISNIEIYPNPASESITINFGNMNTAKQRMEIRDLNGRVLCVDVLHGEKTKTVDVSMLARGMYLVSVGGLTAKIIKE